MHGVRSEPSISENQLSSSLIHRFYFILFKGGFVLKIKSSIILTNISNIMHWEKIHSPAISWACVYQCVVLSIGQTPVLQHVVVIIQFRLETHHDLIWILSVGWPDASTLLDHHEVGQLESDQPGFFLEQAHLWKNESLSSDKVTKFYLEELCYSEWLILTLGCSLQQDGDIKKCNGPDQNWTPSLLSFSKIYILDVYKGWTQHVTWTDNDLKTSFCSLIFLQGRVTSTLDEGHGHTTSIML